MSKQLQAKAVVLQENGTQTAAENGAQTVAGLFANPPEWLPGLLEKYHQDPERYFGSLCHTVAAAVYKDGSVAGEDVAEEVRAIVGQNVVNVDAGEYCDEYIGRGKRGSGLKKSKWHNPFLMDLPDKKRDGTREEVVQKFDRYLDGPVENYEGKVFDGRHLIADLHEIAGKTLGCHCAPLPCHGDVLARRAEREQGDTWKG